MRTSTQTRLAALTAVLAFGFSLQAQAQSVSTVPVGAMTYTFPATTQITTTPISIPLTNPAVHTGTVASLTANTITFSGTPFIAGELAQASNPFFARISSGAQSGRTVLVTANTANTITVDTTDNSSQTTALDAAGWAVTVGNKIDIIVGDTLATLFGDASVEKPLLFNGATNPLFADTISIYNKTTGLFENYYFNTTSGYWRLVTINSNRNGLTIYPESAINVTRRAGRSETKLTVTGEVPVVPHLTKVTGGTTTVYTGSRVPVDVTLGSLGYAGWIKNNSPLFSDSVSIYNPASGKFDIYFQRADNNQWNKVGGGLVDYTNLILPSGLGLAITKRGVVSGAASQLFASLPYSL